MPRQTWPLLLVHQHNGRDQTAPLPCRTPGTTSYKLGFYRKWDEVYLISTTSLIYKRVRGQGQWFDVSSDVGQGVGPTLYNIVNTPQNSSYSIAFLWMVSVTQISSIESKAEPFWILRHNQWTHYRKVLLSSFHLNKDKWFKDPWVRTTFNVCVLGD